MLEMSLFFHLKEFRSNYFLVQYLNDEILRSQFQSEKLWGKKKTEANDKQNLIDSHFQWLSHSYENMLQMLETHTHIWIYMMGSSYSKPEEFLSQVWFGFSGTTDVLLRQCSLYCCFNICRSYNFQLNHSFFFHVFALLKKKSKIHTKYFKN